MRLAVLLACVAASGLGCATNSLRWTSVGNDFSLNENTLQQGANEKLQAEKIKVIFEDGRPEPRQKFGENVESGRLFTTDDDVLVWVATHWTQMLSGWGFEVVQQGETLRVRAQLKKALVTEAGAFNADVIVRYSIDRPDGTQIWQGTLTSQASRHGRTENVDNYHEALSQAVAGAARDFANNPAMLAVLR